MIRNTFTFLLLFGCQLQALDSIPNDKMVDTAFQSESKANRFERLSLSEQVKLLSRADACAREEFLLDHPEMLYIEDLKIPPTVEIIKESNHFKIVSKREYLPGDVIYTSQTLTFPDSKLLLVHIEDEFILLDNVRHTVSRGNSHREFFYFDTFMNHSCNPNTISYFLSPNHYEGRALRHISCGEELTCDYAVFDTTPDGEGFKCQCGAENCRGFVY